MPVFEYKCSRCEHQFERLVLTPTFSNKTTDTAKCPECGAIADKVISQSQLRFWGGGWTKPNVKKNW